MIKAYFNCLAIIMSSQKGSISMASGYRPEIIQSAFVDFIGSRLQPFWSLTVPKLRLVARHQLSEELIALQFEVNRAFKQRAFDSYGGWQGGQYINLTVVIDGIYHQRSYSLVGLPQQTLWWSELGHSKSAIKNLGRQRHTVTIALKPQGLVSDYLTRHAAIGTIFPSSVPSGNFTLQQTILSSQARLSDDQPTLAKLTFNSQTPLLLIAGGSGITPMLGLIKQALQHQRPVTLVHYNRGSVLESYWQLLAAEQASFNYYLINTEDPASYLGDSRHLQASSLLALNLPLLATQIFACGAPALLAGLYKAVDEIDAGLKLSEDLNLLGDLQSVAKSKLEPRHSLRDNIIIERFGTDLAPQAVEAMGKQSDIQTHTVYLRSRQQQFSSDSTLLLAAEQAGIRLNYGCRQGICQLCRCNKVSGVVKNIQTGKLSGDGYDSIQTCLSVAMSDVVLDL